MKASGKARRIQEISTRLEIPAVVTPRCARSACLGALCSAWRHCGPGTAVGGYGSLLDLAPVRVETCLKARRIAV